MTSLRNLFAAAALFFAAAFLVPNDAHAVYSTELMAWSWFVHNYPAPYYSCSALFTPYQVIECSYGNNTGTDDYYAVRQNGCNTSTCVYNVKHSLWGGAWCQSYVLTCHDVDTHGCTYTVQQC